MQEHGQESLYVMGAIKRALDPKSLLNPGKLGNANVFMKR